MKLGLATCGLQRNCCFQTHWIFIIILVALMSVLTSCGESKPEKKPLSFQNITQKDGLSSEMVYAITVQGEEVWFGTYGAGPRSTIREQNMESLYHKR